MSAVFVVVFLVTSVMKLVVSGLNVGPETLITFATFVFFNTFLIFVNPTTSPCCPAVEVLLFAYLTLP